MSAFILRTDLLKPDLTEFLLAQISLQISDQIEVASLLNAQPLRPSSPAIAVHMLWSLSLNLSLTSALVQQVSLGQEGTHVREGEKPGGHPPSLHTSGACGSQGSEVAHRNGMGVRVMG